MEKPIINKISSSKALTDIRLEFEAYHNRLEQRYNAAIERAIQAEKIITYIVSHIEDFAKSDNTINIQRMFITASEDRSLINISFFMLPLTSKKVDPSTINVLASLIAEKIQRDSLLRSENVRIVSNVRPCPDIESGELSASVSLSLYLANGFNMEHIYLES